MWFNRERANAQRLAAAACALGLLCLTQHSLSAEVKYQHPDLTIVAENEPLDAVLKSLSREMRIFVTVPSGLNPVVNSNIQSQPIQQALKTLLGDMSYSLEWEEGGERLAGLTIFVSNARSVAGAPASNTQGPAPLQAAPVDTAGRDGVPAVAGGGGNLPAAVEANANAMEQRADMEAMRAEHEARMAEEREAHEAEMALRREQEEAEQEARMVEETARHEAEMRAYIESQGLKFPD